MTFSPVCVTKLREREWMCAAFYSLHLRHLIILCMQYNADIPFEKMAAPSIDHPYSPSHAQITYPQEHTLWRYPPRLASVDKSHIAHHRHRRPSLNARRQFRIPKHRQTRPLVVFVPPLLLDSTIHLRSKPGLRALPLAKPFAGLKINANMRRTKPKGKKGNARRHLPKRAVKVVHIRRSL
jgi:hypothetical protein